MTQPSYFSKFSTIKFERRDGILELALHTSGGPVVWRGTTSEELEVALEDVAKDPENRVLILTGTGDAFAPLRPPVQRSYDGGTWYQVWSRGIAMITNMLDVPVPVIAAINGPCHVHLELALLSDIVLLTDDAELSDSAHLPTGMVPGDGMHVVMPYLMGRLRASYFLFTCQVLSAVQAKDMGLANEIVPREALRPRAWELASDLLRHPDITLRLTRHLLTEPLKKRMSDLLAMGLAVQGMSAWQQFSKPATR